MKMSLISTGDTKPVKKEYIWSQNAFWELINDLLQEPRLPNALTILLTLPML